LISPKKALIERELADRNFPPYLREPKPDIWIPLQYFFLHPVSD
jgi:hypothetical protein